MLVTILAFALSAVPQGPVCSIVCSDVALRNELAQCTSQSFQARSECEEKVNHARDAFVRTYEKLMVCASANSSLQGQLNQCQAELAKKTKKPVKKVVVVEPPKKEEPKACGCPTCCSASTTTTVAPVVNVTVVNSAQAVQEVSFWHRERPSWLLGVRGAGGTAFCAPQGIALVGVRGNYLPIHLGVDVYTEFFHGTGVQLLVYPVQSRMAMWYVNGGAIWFNQRPFLLPNLPRQVDLTLGTGLELRVLPFLWVTADLVVRMPNPVAIAATGEPFGTVFGKSLVQTQGMLGLMLRTW